MTTRKTTKPKAPKPRAPRAPKKPPTQEQLLGSIGQLLDQVEAHMAERDTKQYARNVDWTRSYYGPLADLRQKLQPHLSALEELLDAASPENHRPDASSVVAATLGTQPGDKLTWSRPGRFLAWMGDIPVRCVWGGFAFAHMNAATALSPRKMFLSNDGAVELYAGSIEPGDASPEALLRKRIMQRLHVRQSSSRRYASPPPLVQLSRAGVERVNAFRADPAHSWWLDASAGSPVDAIPLPPDLPVVQTSLFG